MKYAKFLRWSYIGHMGHEINVIYQKCNTQQHSTMASVYNIMKMKCYCMQYIKKWYMVKYDVKEKKVRERLTQKFKEQVTHLKRKLIKHNLIIRWNNEVLSRVPGIQDLIKRWYSKYVFIRIHPKPDTSYFGPIIVVD